MKSSINRVIACIINFKEDSCKKSTQRKEVFAGRRPRIEPQWSQYLWICNQKIPKKRSLLKTLQGNNEVFPFLISNFEHFPSMKEICQEIPLLKVSSIAKAPFYLQEGLSKEQVKLIWSLRKNIRI